MKEQKSEAQFYALSEVPFEPTGSATDKYPYVAPKRFSIIEQMIDEVVRERKLYFIIFRAPQGGGKTATATELKRRVDAKKYAAGKGVLILNKLVDLDFSHYAADFMHDAMRLLPDFKWEKYKDKTSPGELRNAVASVLKNLGAKHSLVVWAIDEFDIMVDYPKEKQSQFLQILREIIEELSNERLPILFLMSHTMKSSKEFEKHLKEIHGPLQSRVVATLDIGYTYPETRAIVAARLRSIRKKELAFNSIEPFSEEALRELYNLTVVTGGAGELNDFRLFERCCYFAILEGARKKRKSIEKEDAQQIFQLQFKPWAKEEGGERLSLGVKTELASILSGPQMARNESVLKGLVGGFKLMKDQFSEITGVRTRYEQKVAPDVHISSLQFEVLHKPTAKKVSVIWVLSSKESGAILPDDLKKVDQAISKALEVSTYVNLRILGYVSDLELGRSQTTQCDHAIRISPDTMRDLIGLSVESASPDDVDLLRRNFDSDIAPLIRKIFDESTRDITKEVSPTVCRLIKALNISHAAAVKLTKEGLKDEEKKLFGSDTRVADKHLSDLMTLGFAKEEGTQIIPEEPKALTHLENLLQKQTTLKLEGVHKEFAPNGDAVLNVAQNLGLVTIEGERVLRRGQDLRREVEKHAATIAPLLSKEVKGTFDGERGVEMMKAVERTKPDGVLGTIVLSATLELIPTIEERLGKVVPVIAEPSAQEKAPAKEQVKATRVQIPLRERYEPTKLEKVVLSILQTNQPMTLEQLKRELASQGFSVDTTSQIISMVMQNKLKLVA
jgi:hypothetical protein